MSKFYGKIGFVSTEETAPGIWTERIKERNYYGETLRTTKQASTDNKRNEDITIFNELSILADPYAMNNFSRMRYIEFMGTLWEVNGVEVKFPRLIITTGGIYNGNTGRTAI